MSEAEERLAAVVELAKRGWISGELPGSYALAIRDIALGVKTLSDIEHDWKLADVLSSAVLS